MPINKITSESTPPRPLISHKPNPPVRVRLYPPNVSPLPSSVRSSDRPVSALQPPAFSFLLILPPKRPAQNPDLRKTGRRPHGVCRAGVPDASTLISRIQASLGHDDDAVIISFPFFHHGKSSYSTRGAKSPFPVLNNAPSCQRETIELRRKPSKKPVCLPPSLTSPRD